MDSFDHFIYSESFFLKSSLFFSDIQSVIQSWEEQKEVLREQVKLFWMSNEHQYKMWWLLCGEDIRRGKHQLITNK